MGRPPIRKKGAFTAAERQSRRRKRVRREAKDARLALKHAEEAAELKARGYSSPLEAAKGRAREAHRAAVESDTRGEALYNRWWANALSSASDMEDDVAEEMYRRLAICLEIVVDMRGWPAGKLRGVTA